MIRKTNDEEILKMLDEGKSLQEIADHFEVSKQAISKRKQRLLPPEEPASFKNLTQKQKKFVLEMADGKTQTQAAIASFEVNSLDSAKSLGSELMAKNDIKMAVSELMQEEGLTKRVRVKKLKEHINAKDPGTSLKALDQSWKLDGAYVERHEHHIMTREEFDAIPAKLEELEEEEKKLLAERAQIIEAEAKVIETRNQTD